MKFDLLRAIANGRVLHDGDCGWWTLGTQCDCGLSALRSALAFLRKERIDDPSHGNVAAFVEYVVALAEWRRVAWPIRDACSDEEFERWLEGDGREVRERLDSADRRYHRRP